MIQIDRMLVDDVGGNPEKLAEAVLGQLNDISFPIPVREIASAVDIYEIREEELRNLEGCLITSTDKSDGSILINFNASEQRKRFTIGHELGHYLNPYHKAPSGEGFRCSRSDLSIDVGKSMERGPLMEAEANEFAGRLLLPNELTTKFMRGGAGVDINKILSLSTKSCVSREATARRCIDLSTDPMAVVFSKNGVVRYIKRHPEFPSTKI